MNVLIALAWPNHVHHVRALRWFEAVGGEGWATCPADADARAFDGLVGRRQVTDAHLLTLARKRGGRLATLDRGVLELASDDPSSGHAHPVSPGAR